MSRLGITAKDFYGSLQVIIGVNDYPFCGGDCMSPEDQAALLQPHSFPSANQNMSESVLIPNAGHNLNAHYNAGMTFTKMLDFVRKVGL